MGTIPVSLEERLERALFFPPDPMHGAVPEGQYACDMHVHSSHSTEIPALPRYSPLAKMVLALERGMHYFALTDHDTYTGVLELQEQLAGMGSMGETALKRFIPGVEVKVHVERVGQVVHTNIYGLSEKQWQAIQAMYHLKDEIMEFETLTDYLRSENLIYSFNHPFWKPIGRNQLPGLFKRIIPRMSSAHDDPISLVSLGLIFPEFPLIELNGSRIESLNDLAEYFALVHGIPLIGGSDDHYGMSLAGCCTLAAGDTWQEYLEEIKDGRAGVMRSHLDEQKATKKAEHVVELLLDGSCDTAKYLGQLLLIEFGKLAKKVIGLWKPKYLPYSKRRLVKIGVKGYLQSQYSCLPLSWNMAVQFGERTPVREALDRLREKQ